MAIEQQARDWKSLTINSIVARKIDRSYALASGSNSIATNKITEDINGKKLIVAVSVEVAFADVAMVATIEGSLDGTNWMVVNKITSDLKPNILGVSFYTTDLTDHTSIPYYRVHINGGVAETPVAGGTSGLLSISYVTGT